MGLNKVLICKYASRGRSRIIDEYKEKYLSKKGDRFFVEGITYEIGQIFHEEGELEIEISSKIPVEDIGEKNKKKYFNLIKKEIEKQKLPPYYIAVEDIVKEIGERKLKKRDYLRLKYRANPDHFYDDKAIMKTVENIQQTPEDIPSVPEVNSVPGKLVLAATEENFYLFIKGNMDDLIQLNQKAQKSYALVGAA